MAERFVESRESLDWWKRRCAELEAENRAARKVIPQIAQCVRCDYPGSCEVDQGSAECADLLIAWAREREG